MSDVMPYQSSRFCNLTDVELFEYENCFEKKLKTLVKQLKPDIIHRHHLWLSSALARDGFSRSCQLEQLAMALISGNFRHIHIFEKKLSANAKDSMRLWL
jgi:hypothetical protein